MKSCGTYQDGYVCDCPGCGRSNFYVDYLGRDVWGNLPEVSGLPEERACLGCGMVFVPRKLFKAIRFSCPGCHKTTVNVREPSDVVNEEGAVLVIYRKNDVQCGHCDAVFETFLIMHDDNEPSWWLSWHLCEKRPAPEISG